MQHAPRDGPRLHSGLDEVEGKSEDSANDSRRKTPDG
eukprot:CAMPEP_0183296722 /NCGR_PEP_ID=MMETSP0160_2-20130417/4170_1 /TAXON_ID=2839 ORGANISM="Odontella Sinensis, Strain Grunow 1884" /NCGR_SAMPLE_ID=MMETSP0160_2 /ASSEMBLY_ACC=CAM_ASM_000250 /LENGTH=36 /DNA_ID= /DNA_START= /DNA_END= /DNA_ORIENTATION=